MREDTGVPCTGRAAGGPLTGRSSINTRHRSHFLSQAKKNTTRPSSKTSSTLFILLMTSHILAAMVVLKKKIAFLKDFYDPFVSLCVRENIIFFYPAVYVCLSVCTHVYVCTCVGTDIVQYMRI